MNGKSNRKRIWAFSMAALLPLLLLGLIFLVLSLLPGKTEEIVTVERGTAIEAVYGSGIVRAQRQYDVRAGAYSIINKFVSEGQRVAAGAALIELSELGIVRAPFPGIVTWIGADVRETSSRGNIVLRLVDPSRLYLAMVLEQRGVVRVRAGQSARVNFEGLEEKNYYGKVRSVFSNGRDFIVHVGLPRLPAQILPGMKADVAIVVNRKDNALLVPVAAVDEGKVTVKTDAANRVEEVELGDTVAGKAELLRGDLEAGDQLVVRK